MQPICAGRPKFQDATDNGAEMAFCGPVGHQYKMPSIPIRDHVKCIRAPRRATGDGTAASPDEREPTRQISSRRQRMDLWGKQYKVAGPSLT